MPAEETKVNPPGFSASTDSETDATDGFLKVSLVGGTGERDVFLTLDCTDHDAYFLIRDAALTLAPPQCRVNTVIIAVTNSPKPGQVEYRIRTTMKDLKFYRPSRIFATYTNPVNDLEGIYHI
jgi:hypothetical protein